MRISILSKALEVSGHGTDSIRCVNVSNRYREACLVCGRDPSLLQKLEAINPRFPLMKFPWPKVFSLLPGIKVWGPDVHYRRHAN